MEFLRYSAFLVNDRVTEGDKLCDRKSNETMGITESAQLAVIAIILHFLMPSEIDSAECDIRAVNVPFGVCHLPLAAESEKRKCILTVCVSTFKYPSIRTYLKTNNVRR